MVYYATQGMILVVSGSMMLAGLFKQGLHLRPFHADGCNGLRPVGSLIFFLWVFALVLAASIFVAMGVGYLGLEQTPLAWALALFAMLTIPFAAIVPLHACVNAILRARTTELGRLEPLLDAQYRTSLLALNKSQNDTKAGVERYSTAQAMHTTLKDMNIWPFDPRALSVVVLAYAAQVLITLHEFVGSLAFQFLE